jgi:hypothetical protein
MNIININITVDVEERVKANTKHTPFAIAYARIGEIPHSRNKLVINESTV